MDGVRTVSESFVLCNILEVEVEHNGIKGGDAGHGGYVKIRISDVDGNTAMDAVVTREDDAKGDEAKEIVMTFRGDHERDTLLAGLKMIVKELEEND